jgi:hypothetical protein
MHQDLGGRQELPVAAGVVEVLVGIQEVLDRLRETLFTLETMSLYKTCIFESTMMIVVDNSTGWRPASA